jgi:hypothetical protein
MPTFTELRQKIPAQALIEEFLEGTHFPSNPNNAYHLSELVDATQKHFDIPEESADLKLADYGYNGHGNEGTFLETLVQWGMFEVTNRKMAKKVGPNKWAHPNCVLPAFKCQRVSQKLVGECVVVVKILKDLNFTPEKARLEIMKHWDSDVLSLAIKKVYSNRPEPAPSTA